MCNEFLSRFISYSKPVTSFVYRTVKLACNAKKTICDQQVCQNSPLIRLFHTSLHFNEYYFTLSYGLKILVSDIATPV